MLKKFTLLLCLLFSMSIISQEQNLLNLKKTHFTAIQKSKKKQARLERREARELRNIRPYDALAPSKAAFYSAVLPGLGQTYTGKYWKIPIVYASLGTGIGIAIWNQNQYDKFRDIHKNRLLGINDDKYSNNSNEQIASHYEKFKKNKELSILLTVVMYALNIVDANVTAHLQQYNINEKISLNSNIKLDDYVTDPNYGLSLSYSF